MPSFDSERQELLNAVASYKNSADVIEYIKSKLQQHNKDTYEEWEKNDFYINHLFVFGTLLHFTLRSESEDVVESVIKAGADVNLQDFCEVTPLQCAAENGDVRIVETLLKAGAKLDVQDNMKKTALHRAAAKGHSEVVEALIRAGTNANIEDANKMTPLHLAAENGCVRVVEALLKAGARIDVQNDMKNTALHVAVKRCRLEVVEALIKAGADVNLKYYDKSPYSFLGIEKGVFFSLYSAAQNGCARIVEVLLKAGAEINEATDGFETALHAAVQCNHSEVVGILIKAGADVNVQGCDEMTPLHHAVGEDRSWMVEALLKAGADPNVPDFCGRTPLHYAGRRGYVPTLEALLKAGADVYIQDWEAKNALRYPDVVRILILHEIPLKVSKEQNQSYVPQGYSSDFERKHSQYRDDCLSEVKKMKEVKIDNDMTFYDFLRTKDINKLASQVRNKNRALMIETYIHDNQFPIYKKYLRRQVKIGKERLYYLDVASVILKNMEHVSALSHFFHIILLIAEKFTNEEIEELKGVVIEVLDRKKKRNFLNTEMDLENTNNAQRAGHDSVVKRKRLRRE